MIAMRVLRMVEEQFHRDVEDRPIREGRMPIELQRAGEIEYRPCPYAGSRHQHSNPMNVSALRQTSAHWDEIVDALAMLREAYAKACGGYRGDVMDLWRVSQLGSALPWFFLLHDGVGCPGYAAALAKATLGVGIWGQRLFVRMLAERRMPERVTAQMIFDTAEATGTLVSDAEVCSASEKMMLRFFDVLVDERIISEGRGEAGALAGRGEAVLRFGAHYVGFKQWLWIYCLARRFLYADLVAALGPRADLAELLAAGVEPPDFFFAEPADPASMPAPQRAVWFHALANLVVPFAADHSDRPLREHALRLAALMGEDHARGVIARACATFAALDALHGDVIACVEAGLGGDASRTVIDPTIRDRVVATSPRALFDELQRLV